MRDDVLQTESWTQFHQKHHSDRFHYSVRNEQFVKQNSHSCLSGFCYVDDSDENEKSWFSSFLDVFASDAASDNRRLRRVGDDGDSSVDSGASGKKNKLRIPSILKTKKKERRKGNIKISDCSR